MSVEKLFEEMRSKLETHGALLVKYFKPFQDYIRDMEQLDFTAIGIR